MALAFSVFFVENTRHQIHRTVLQYLAAAKIPERGIMATCSNHDWQSCYWDWDEPEGAPASIALWRKAGCSHKRLATYLKVQMTVKQLREPSKEAKDKCVRRLAKAISNLMIQTTEPIPKCTLLDPVSLLCTFNGGYNLWKMVGLKYYSKVCQ